MLLLKCTLTLLTDHHSERNDLKATHKYINRTYKKQSNLPWLLHAPVHMCGHKA